MRSHFSTLQKILWNPYRIVFLLVGMACFGVVAALMSNYALVLETVAAPALHTAEKLAFLLTLFSDPVDTYGAKNLVLFLIVDFLFVLNVLVLQQLFKAKIFLQGRSALLNLSALFAAVIGLGCFSCGSVLLFFFLSVFGLTFSSIWVRTEMWILLLSIALFVISISISLKKLKAPLVC